MGKPTGRPPKPIEQKRRTGNPGRRPLPEVVALPPVHTVEPSRFLGEHGRLLWERAALSGAHWIADTDRDLLLMVCEQVDERQLLRAQVFRDGHWRDRLALRQLDAAITTGLSLLGFTPVDRARIGAGEVTQTDDLQEFRRRAAARRTGT